MSRKKDVVTEVEITGKVIAIYEEVREHLEKIGEPAEGLSLQAYRGTVTRVHEELQLKKPAPYTELPSHIELEEDGSLHVSRAEHAQICAHQRSLQSDHEHLTAAKARSGPDGQFHDTHHFVQREHGKALWEEARAMVKASGITEAGRS